VNYPNEKKRERGRIVVPTRGLEFSPETPYAPERFSAEFPAPQAKPNGDGKANGHTDTMRIISENTMLRGPIMPIRTTGASCKPSGDAI
jgi:hypothetical protein